MLNTLQVHPLKVFIVLKRLAFTTRHQFFPACPPFVNTVYSAKRTQKDRVKASRNEYSKKSMGEISTAAYNTSLENTNCRNRYCN